MGGGNSICNSYPDCCDGFNFVSDEDINATYALTHWQCYPNGIPPWFDNSTKTVNETLLSDYLALHNIPSFNYTNYNLTNLTQIVNTELPFGVNFTEIIQFERENFIDTKLAWKHGTVDIPKLVVSISGIMSISSVLIAILVYVGVVIYQPNLYSFHHDRDNIAMLISELIYGIVQLYQFIDDDAIIYNPDLINIYDNWKCTTTAALQVWSKLSSFKLFFVCCIAVNLVLVFVFEITRKNILQIVYFMLSLLLPCILIAYPLSQGQLGWHAGSTHNFNGVDPYAWHIYCCFFRMDKKAFTGPFYRESSQIAQTNIWTFYNAWIIISIGICLGSLIFYFTKLYDLKSQSDKYEKKIKSLSNNIESSENSPVNQVGFDKDREKSLFYKSIARTSLFLYVPILCSLPEAVLNARISFSNNREFLYFALFMSAFAGVLNSIIFFFDPVIILILGMIRKLMVNRYVLKLHSVDEDGTRSSKPSFTSKGIIIKKRKRTFLRRLITIPVSASWPFLSYYFVKILLSRTSDFASKSIPVPKDDLDKRFEIDQEMNQIKIVKITKIYDENILSNNLQVLNGPETHATPNDLQEEPFDQVEAFQKFENL